MAKYRKILVAYDGSPSARNALTEACRLAKADKSWIKVLAVLPTYEGDLELIGVSRIGETISGPGQTLLSEARAIADAADVQALTNMAQGEPYERIVHVAEDENCDLIVMGRRGLTHLDRGLMGSVTARVIGHTPKDVLVVPATAAIDWRHVLLATDGSACSESAVAKAIGIARERNVRLTAASVAYTNDEISALAPEAVNALIRHAKGLLQEIQQQAAAEGVSLETAVREGEPAEAILALAAEIDASLIVMSSHGRKGLSRLLMGSVTEHVIGLGCCPVLVSHCGSTT
ncbi:MAG: universal stress protein [Thermodesulfobacteriota bacterium]